MYAWGMPAQGPTCMCVITTPALTPITCTCCPPSVLLSFRHCRSARVSALFWTSRSGAGTEDSRPTTVPTTSTETATHGTTSTQTDTAPTTTTADPRLAGSLQGIWVPLMTGVRMDRIMLTRHRTPCPQPEGEPGAVQCHNIVADVEQWYGHNTTCFPRNQHWDQRSNRATHSWIFVPIILAAILGIGRCCFHPP